MPRPQPTPGGRTSPPVPARPDGTGGLIPAASRPGPMVAGRLGRAYPRPGATLREAYSAVAVLVFLDEAYKKMYEPVLIPIVAA
jgi:hypothetical protein